MKIWRLLVGVFLLVLAVFLSLKPRFFGSEEEGNRASVSQLLPAKSSSLDSKTLASRRSSLNFKAMSLSPSEGVEPSPNFPEEGVHEAKDLAHFYLPPLSLQNVTLREAIRAILQSYTDVCVETRQLPLAFSISIAESDLERIDLELGNTTLTKAFLAAAHAFESRLLREQTSLSFESYSMKQESVGIGSTEQSFILPPVFFENLNGLSTNSAPQVSSETIEAILRDYGFLTEDGSGAQFDAASGRLVLSEGLAELDRFQQLYDEVTRAPAQVRLESRLFDSQTSSSWPEESLSPDRYQNTLREMQQVESVDLMTLPSVVARMGEQSTIEQIREVIYPGDDGEFVTDWTGIRVSSTPEGHGFGFRQTSHFESRELVGDGENLSAASFSSNEIQIGDIAPNRFTLSANQEIEGNRELSFLSVPQLIDASGQAILAGPEQ